MSPTIVFRDGRPVLAVGRRAGPRSSPPCSRSWSSTWTGEPACPGDRAPRVSQRNSDPGDAEPAFLASPEAAELQALGELFRPAPATAPLPSEIGAAAGIALGRHGLLQAAAEPVRRGGGSALVVHPRP